MSQSPNPSSSSIPPRLLGFDREEAAYLFPMAAFLLLIGAGGWFPDYYPLAYLSRAAVVPVLLICFWKYYTKIRWDYWWLGALFGVIGIVQWVGMEKLLEHYGHGYPWFMNRPDPADPKQVFNPFAYPFFQDHPGMMWTWITIRWATASITVPFMEELFWRDWLWRQIIAPADFKLAKIGEWEPMAFWGVAVMFAVPHPQWWLTAIVWALLSGLLLLKTRSIGACIVMHGVTNFLLGAYVMWTKEFIFW